MWNSFSTARMVKEQETIPNKELLKELDVFRLEKNGLGRQKSYISSNTSPVLLGREMRPGLANPREELIQGQQS